MKRNLLLIQTYAFPVFTRVRRTFTRWIGDLRVIFLKGSSIRTDIGSGMREAIQESIEQTFGKLELEDLLTLAKPGQSARKLDIQPWKIYGLKFPRRN